MFWLKYGNLILKTKDNPNSKNYKIEESQTKSACI